MKGFKFVIPIIFSLSDNEAHEKINCKSQFFSERSHQKYSSGLTSKVHYFSVCVPQSGAFPKYAFHCPDCSVYGYEWCSHSGALSLLCFLFCLSLRAIGGGSWWIRTIVQEKKKNLLVGTDTMVKIRWNCWKSVSDNKRNFHCFLSLCLSRALSLIRWCLVKSAGFEINDVVVKTWEETVRPFPAEEWNFRSLECCVPQYFYQNSKPFVQIIPAKNYPLYWFEAFSSAIVVVVLKTAENPLPRAPRD